MTSSAVFHLGGGAAGGGATPAASTYSWTIQHAPSGVPLGTPLGGHPLGSHPLGGHPLDAPLDADDIARSLSPPLDPWSVDGSLVGGPSSWSSPSWQGEAPVGSPYPFHDPFRGQGPYHRRPQKAPGFRDPSAEPPPPPPVQWLSPPEAPEETPAGGGAVPVAPEADSWQHTPRPWTSSGQGVVSLLPWFLGMTVVGGANSPVPAAPAAGTRTSPNTRYANRPARPGRPGAAVPAGAGTSLRGQGAAAAAGAPGTVSTKNGRLRELYKWKTVDYEYPDKATRDQAIKNKDYDPNNNLPLGVEAYGDRIFVSIPRWKPGVPATLAYVAKDSKGDPSPLLRPYPDWSWHRVPRKGVNDSCQALTSVFRMVADECGRLWVLDSGSVDAVGEFRVVCPPQIFIFNLQTDELVWKYTIPKEQAKSDSLFTNIVVDIRDGQCDDAHAYAADVFRYGLLVYSFREDRSYRVAHNYFFPDPIASRFDLDQVTFRWMDGIFGLAMTPVDKRTNDRTLFFHPMASFREFSVPVSIIRNETVANSYPDDFKIVGLRGRNHSHSSASALDRRGVLFFNLVTADALGCWDTAKPYSSTTVGHVAKDSELLNFPNDLKVDREEPQNIWLLTNRLHLFFYRSLDPNEYNYRILTGTTDKAVEGSICDPANRGPHTSVPKEIDACEFV